MIDATLDKINKIVPQKWQWILSHEGFRKYFKNTGWMFFGKMFSLIISFFIGTWIARYLGPENYGILNYSIAFVGLFEFICFLGVDGILNRELIKFPEKRDELLGTSFWMKTIGGFIAFLLAVISILMFKASSLIKLLVILFAFSFLLQSINVISIYFQASIKSKNNVKVALVTTIISTILKIIVVLLNKGVIWLVVVYVLDSLWQGIGFLIIYKQQGLKLKNWRLNKQLSLEILKVSWPLMLASAAGFIYLKIDQVMIGLLMSSHDVGIYAAAVRLVEVWYFIPGIICSSLFPAIINAKMSNQLIYRNRLKKFYILMIAIPVIIAIPSTILARPIMYVLFGAGYLESVVILQIYIWSSIGLFLGWAINQYLMSENLVKVIFWLSFSGMLVNIILNLLFIPIFGLQGSAWATLISYLFIPISAWFFIKYNKKYEF